MLRVLILHCRYRKPGGEEVVANNEHQLLTARGHDVLMIVQDTKLGSTIQLGKEALGLEPMSYRIVAEAIDDHKPDVVHCHNIFSRFGPRALDAIRDAGVPCVMTVHNYRTFCIAGTIFRDGHECRDCVGRRGSWPGVIYGCYRGSRLQSAVQAAALSRFDWSGVHFIAVSAFVKAALVNAGVAAADQITVKHNFTPAEVQEPTPRGNAPRHAIFIASTGYRPEKGHRLLAEAWNLAGKSLFDLRIGGGGVPHDAVLEQLRRAAFLVVPSLWPEPCPMVAIEALSVGTPILVTDVGGLPEIVGESGGGAGLIALPKVEFLADAIELMLDGVLTRRELAYERWRACFSPDATYRQLMAIYRSAIASRQACAIEKSRSDVPMRQMIGGTSDDRLGPERNRQAP